MSISVVLAAVKVPAAETGQVVLLWQVAAEVGIGGVVSVALVQPLVVLRDVLEDCVVVVFGLLFHV